MQTHSAQRVPVVSMCHQKLWGPLWRSLVPTVCGYYGPCDTKKCVGAYARPRLAYDILWVAVPTTLCCGWWVADPMPIMSCGWRSLHLILDSLYRVFRMYPYGIHVSPKLCRSLWRPCVMYIVCVAMASMCHLKCAGPLGVHVSPRICGFLWHTCVT